MKLFKIKYFAILAFTTAVVATGCKKAEFAINTNPDDVTASTVDYKSVLPAAQSYTATITANRWRFLQHWMGYWARSGSYQSEDQIETYEFTNDFQNSIWNNYYYNANNYNFIVTNANAKGAGTYEAIGRIMKALDFQVLVDIYGNLPYSEAFKGTDFKTPKYDDDVAIYNDLLRQCDIAIGLLKDPILSAPDANPAIATNDLMFKGNTTNWIKFANTLKLRLLIHASTTKFDASGGEINSFAPGIDVVAEGAAIAAEGSGFIEAGETAQIEPGYSSTKPNPYYRTYRFTETGTVASSGDVSKANKYAVGASDNGGYYQYNGDKRVNQLYEFPKTTPPTTVHRGITFGEVSGVDANNQGNKLSTIWGKGLLPNEAATKAWIFTSTESLFLQAEALYRGILPGGSPAAQAKLADAVTESFVWLGLTTTDATNYLAGNAGYPDVDITAGSLGAGLPGGGIYTILSQKWFALNATATLEVWTDFRRSDIEYGAAVGFDPGPPISIHPNNSHLFLPTRLFYPQNEYNYNAANVAAETPNGGIDLFNPATQNRIFWDLN
ncbi:MAG: SusD/RagB family nutrient-binding outer membrane lipoprotein [Chitinophagaceae bacterium]|mgnify:FL=1|jgi:hypothetical protein|nr:SusD/RagB family nutrient-binding outer membrane lipoprotein [Chitinophagaceae bacterium]MBP6047264.1 SusD/RagB family nutrient-binding outer membrane lipoprotein [Ferruginibacter sp.]NMD28261.1 SusD/RagB family nutrient-binding outer membrane lipoprotein [Bacteroidota bacterium]MBK7089912.1 SusD/RagB family nutrient-binding outer membrane lipoprotein [Chitinophagaceae bacterium]MBK8775495.1 SusD/RagB family nutrient-binding outer membrane lipoprotein [Chitinophagaceae bacterium]